MECSSVTSDTTDKDLDALLRAAGLARLAPMLEHLAVSSLRLKTAAAAEEHLPLGASRLGGQPDLPAGAEWPHWNGAPLGFIGQLCLDDLGSSPVAQALPAPGRLYFFYDARQKVYGDKPEDRGAWQVLYQADADDPLQRRPAPDGLPSQSRFRPCSVAYSVEQTLPQRPVLFEPRLDWTPDEQAKYEDFIFQHLSNRGWPRHRLWGHADEIQDDMHLQCQLAAHGAHGINDPRAAELAPGAMNWQLLLQVDTDQNTGMEWGNSGMLYYWIEKDALRARRFDNVWMALQSE